MTRKPSTAQVATGRSHLILTFSLMLATIVTLTSTPASAEPGQRVHLLQTFAGSIDAEAMARDAAGPYWNDASASERARYVDLFRRNLIALVSDLLPQRLPEGKVDTKVLKLPGGDSLIRVMLSINGELIPVGVRLRHGTTPRIVDVLMESASLTRVKAAEIASLARRGGMSAVIAELERRSGNAPVEAAAVELSEATVAVAPASAPQRDAGTEAAELREVVLFPPGSSEAPLDPATLRRLADAAAQRPARISVIGYADPKGPEDKNAALSLERARRIAERLVSAGVPRDKIAIGGRGETPPSPEPLPDAERRRVEIAVLPSS